MKTRTSRNVLSNRPPYNPLTAASTRVIVGDGRSQGEVFPRERLEMGLDSNIIGNFLEKVGRYVPNLIVAKRGVAAKRAGQGMGGRERLSTRTRCREII